jgi:hypothetical protein
MSSARERPGGDQDYAERAARYEEQTGYPMDEREARRVTREAGGVGVWTGRVLAGMLMILNGLLAFAAGIAVIRNPAFVTVNSQYLVHWTARGWGWTELAIGIAVFAAGVGVLLGLLWARVVGVVVATLAALGTFLFLPYYPLWAITLIAIDVFIIWALTAGGLRSRAH